MRIPDWTPQAKPQPPELVQAILDRRGGSLLNLDLALLWSEPLARGWNVFLGNVRQQFGGNKQLRELSICTVALLTGAHYEYHHHAPEYLAAGGEQAELDALSAYCAVPTGDTPAGMGTLESLVAQYAARMTLDVKVPQDLFAQLQDRLGTTELVELTATIAAYNMVARFLVALDVTPED